MKKTFFPVTLFAVVLALVLAACGNAASGSSSGSGSSSAGSNTSQTLSGAAQLLVGTLKLEGSSNAVDAAQAASLLPLWQAYNQLTNSDAAAQAEIDAVVAQIQGTMTKDQVQAITAMKLTRADEFSVMSSLGLIPANGTPDANSTPQAFTFNEGSGGFPSGGAAPSGGGGPAGGGAPPSGGMPSGGFPAGGDPGGGGFLVGGASATQSATQLAARAANANRISPMLMNALIKLLQERAGL